MKVTFLRKCQPTEGPLRVPGETAEIDTKEAKLFIERGAAKPAEAAKD